MVAKVQGLILFNLCLVVCKNYFLQGMAQAWHVQVEVSADGVLRPSGLWVDAHRSHYYGASGSYVYESSPVATLQGGQGGHLTPQKIG